MGSLRLGLVLAVLATLTATEASAKWPKVKWSRENVRIGLPPGRFAADRDETGSAVHISKMNTWAPIYFDVEVVEVDEDPADATMILHVRASDSDGYTTNYQLPLGSLIGRNPGEIIKSTELRWIPYLRPGGFLGDCQLTIRNAKGKDLSETIIIESLRPVDTNRFVVLSLGSRMASFDVRTTDADERPRPQGQTKVDRIVASSILDIAQMPDQWIGYDAADLVVIATGNSKDFVPTLFDPQDKNPAARVRREALLEWVRRGGKLVVSVGTNAGLVSQYKPLQDLLPATIDPANPKTDFPYLPLKWPNAVIREQQLRPRDGTMAIATLRPVRDKAPRELLGTTNPAIKAGANVPLVVTSAYGLGRITVVGFDLDRSPFTDYTNRGDFWTWLLKEAGAQKSVSGHDAANKSTNQYGFSSTTNVEDDFATAMQRDIDRFEGVPVISFGWVALFIILYTLLIGPVEYIILKKVFKRLELTWITFPIIVLTVSVVAYLSAYALKGSDLKLNKFDVIDVDPSSNRVYGRTWVGIFSPRGEDYTVSVTPNTGWSGDKDAATAPQTLTDWLQGNRTSQRQTLFRSSYTYHVQPDPASPQFADALVRVPIKVWSVKSFAAQWSANMDPAAPLLESKLIHPPGDETRSTITGTITHRLPFGTLKDVRLIYAGQVYPVGDIEANVPFRVFLDRQKVEQEWFQNAGNLKNVSYVISGAEDYNRRWGNQNTGPMNPGNLSYWGILFHEAALKTDTPLGNASLRRLDQSWRIDKNHTNEVILIAKVGPTTEPAEELMAKANSPSPTQLWLKGVPSEGKPRTPINGIMRQETYLRVFIPVKPAAGK